MKNKLKCLFLLIVLFYACVMRADASIFKNPFLTQKIQVFGLGGMPWEKSISLEEERARAWVDAMHHAYETILNLQLMEGKVVRQALESNSGLKSRLGAILLSAKKTFYARDNTGLIRCKLDIPFCGQHGIRSALFLAALRPLPVRPISLLASWTRPIAIKDKISLPDYKRVVVDLRNTNFKPSLFPRFFDDKGFLIFQETMLPAHKRFSRAVVKFSNNIRDAYKDLTENQVLMIEGRVPNICTNDVTIPESEATVFRRFSQGIVKHPLGESEILLVYNANKTFGGKLSKTVKKLKKTENKDN